MTALITSSTLHGNMPHLLLLRQACSDYCLHHPLCTLPQLLAQAAGSSLAHLLLQSSPTMCTSHTQMVLREAMPTSPRLPALPPLQAAPDPQRIVQIIQPASNLSFAVQGPPLHAGTLQHPETLKQCSAHLCTLAVLPRLWAAAARSARRLACSARTSASAARARSSSARTVASRCSRAASLWSRLASRSPSACRGSRTG